MHKSEKMSEGVIFPKGKQIMNNYFIGATWLEMLVLNDSTFNCPMGNVTFEPGARNNWHKHPGGQILLVTGGKGYYQEEGKPVKVIKEGDVVKIHPDVKHWHGATPDNWLSHIAISTNPQKGDAEWLEPVTDEEYSSISL